MELNEKQEAARKTWQYRAVQATRANQTISGMILMAALHKVPRHPPAFAYTATIDAEGVVHVRWIDKTYVRHEYVPICTVAEMVENFHRIGDEIKASDAERRELMMTIRQWITKDLRPEKAKVLN